MYCPAAILSNAIGRYGRAIPRGSSEFSKIKLFGARLILLSISADCRSKLASMILKQFPFLDLVILSGIPRGMALGMSGWIPRRQARNDGVWGQGLSRNRADVFSLYTTRANDFWYRRCEGIVSPVGPRGKLQMTKGTTHMDMGGCIQAPASRGATSEAAMTSHGGDQCSTLPKNPNGLHLYHNA